MKVHTKFIKAFGALLIAVLLFAALPAGEAMAQPATLTVCATGCDHTTIQAAIDAASGGDTITVGAGTYAEQLVVDKALTLVGPNTGVPGTGARVAEAEINFPSGITGYQALIEVTADNVSIDGFLIDGQDFPMATAFDDANITDGILADASDFTAKNNVVKNFSRVGVIVASEYNAGAEHTGILIEDNLVTSDATGYFSYYSGIYMQKSYGVVRGNTVDMTYRGIQVQPYNHANSAGSQGVVENNTITAYRNPLYFNYSENANADWLFQNNTVSGNTVSGDSASRWDGLLIQTFTGGNVAFTGNTVNFGTTDATEIYPFGAINWQSGGTGTVDLDATFANNTFERAVVITDGANIIKTQPDMAFYSSIQDAIDAASDGDTIEVGPGTYVEGSSGDAYALELNVANLTVQSTNGRDQTIVDAGGATTGVWVLKNLGDVTFEGFTVENFTDNGVVQSYTQREGTAFHILNNFVDPSNGYLRNGLQVSGNGSTVIGNLVYGAPLTEDWASTGIGVINASNVVVSGNTVQQDLVDATNPDIGINVMNYSALASNVTLENNTVTNAGNGIRISAGDPSYAVEDVTINNNTLDGNNRGINVQNVALDGLDVTNNTIKSNYDEVDGTETYLGIGIRFSDTATAANVTITGNTFSDNESIQVFGHAGAVIDIDAILSTNTLDKAAFIDGDYVIYSTIQGAVDAATAGDTIEVEPGTYTEQVVVNEDLTLVGTGNPTITPPASVDAYTLAESSASWEPVVLAFGGTADGSNAISGTDTINFSMSGFIVDGADRAPSDRSSGILLRNVVGTVSGNTVQNMHVDGKQTFGIIAYGDSTVTIDSNTISGYARGGIAANGDGGALVDPVATITNNTVTGPGKDEDVTWAPNGIQIGWGATGTIEGNTVSENGWPGSAWTGSGIIIYGSDNVLVKDNETYNNETAIVTASAIGTQIEGNDVHDNTYGIVTQTGSQDTTIDGNTVQENTAGIFVSSGSVNTTITNNIVTLNEVDGIDVYGGSAATYPTGTVIEYNQIFGNNTGDNDDSGDLWVLDGIPTVDASPNWWGSDAGPGAEQIYGDVDYVPWCGDPGCTFTLPDANNVVELSGTYNIPGGIEINTPGLTFLLKQGTIIQNDSPCFIVNADDTTILGEYPGEEFCIPTGTSAGIEVAAGVSNLVIKNLDIDGSLTTGPAIDFAGDVDGVRIVNNKIHDFSADGIVFGGEVLTEHVIQGNMFMDITGAEIVSGTTTIDATFNSWGANAVPTLANVTSSPFTHANLWMESSGAFTGDQVALGDSITYTVYADLTEISGAEFTMTYPTGLLALTGTTNGDGEFVGIVDGSGTQQDLLDTSTAGEIKFRGIVPLGDGPVTDTNVVLFTATFDAAASLPSPNLGTMGLVEISQGFSMTPDDPYYTNHVYPAELLDGEVTVVAIPVIDSTDIDGYYLTGETREFNVSVDNPTAANGGGAYDKVLFRFEVTAADGDITLFQYDDGGVWKDMPLDCTTSPGTCVGYYGPSGGFPMAAGYTATTTFQVEFANDGDYPVEITLVDMLAGEAVLADYNNTAVVYTKPVISSTDIVGPYTALIPQGFTLNIDNVDGDMTGVVTEVRFDFPDGTVVSYGGTDYTCASGVCPLIPVTLSAGTNALDFTVEFPTGYVGDVSATLFDTNWTPDRELASETWTATVYNNWAVEGKVTMQGRTYRGDVPMTLTGPTGFAFGPFTEDSLDQMGANIFFTDIAEADYTITTDQDRYLNVPGSVFTIDADTVLPDLYLYGGNVYQDNIIDISDASVVGANYGTTGDTPGDANFDGRTNIQDLAMVGGNWGLDDNVYASWN